MGGAVVGDLREGHPTVGVVGLEKDIGSRIKDAAAVFGVCLREFLPHGATHAEFFVFAKRPVHAQIEPVLVGGHHDHVFPVRDQRQTTIDDFLNEADVSSDFGLDSDEYIR